MRYWKGLDEKNQAAEFLNTLDDEFPQPLPLDTLLNNFNEKNSGVSRRSFLKAAGFSLAGTALAACSRGKVEKAIPLLIAPENQAPGKSYWYASTCAGCSAGCGVMVKTREGRPVKIEGNPRHPLSKGGVCAIGQAMTLSLYDSQRLSQPLLNGQPAEWTTINQQISQQLAELRGDVFILTGTMTSPSTKFWIDRFLSRFQNSAHVQYDAMSCSAILDAHEITYGKRILPRFFFEHADVICSFDADFLGTWISPVEFTKAYTAARSIDGAPPRLSWHIQLESRLSLSGSNADQRVRVSPRQNQMLLLALAERLAQRSGVSSCPLAGKLNSADFDVTLVDEMAERLWQARGKSLVVCGQNNRSAQMVVNFINHLLGNYGRTIDIQNPSYQSKGDDQALQKLLQKIQAGEVQALIIDGCNPLYSLPDSHSLVEAIRKIPLTIYFSSHHDETSASCRIVCPQAHFLESWNDAEIAAGIFSITQPAINPLGQTKSLRECLAAWSGSVRDDFDLLRDFWREHIFPRQKKQKDFQVFWDKSVQQGFALIEPEAKSISVSFNSAALQQAQFDFSEDPQALTMQLYSKISMFDGRHAHNPWLQELPDPISKVVWDNYICLAPQLAERLQIEQGDIMRISDGKENLELPALIQPGQHEHVLSVALGYGRKGTDRFSKAGPQWLESRLTVAAGETVGKNAFIFSSFKDNLLTMEATVSLEPTGKKGWLALTQTHQTITTPKELGGKRRDLIRETTLPEYIVNPSAGNPPLNKILQLWENDHVYEGHHWGLVIDLNRCTGCSGCVVSCQAENNVPVVGKDEVYRRREMHWIRLDRYYSGGPDDVDVLFQPVMCQHCDHAPCEAVCPVLATVHSDEGINQQIYNRCVGTRYCANNCPYKVRRFNWFDYWKETRRENLALNPDITVRSRGVMEKCSLCVQRIQEARAEAKRQGRDIADGEISLACEQSCPGDAIVFGDMNDPHSRISRLINHPRHYRLLEEMNFRPKVGYLTKVRNRQKSTEQD